MYQLRITAFIDILGFRNIVEKTKTDIEFRNKIFDVLNSITSEQITNETFGQVNKEIINDPKELAEAIELHNMLSQRLKQESSLQVTHFSDSIVLSIGLENDMYVMSMLEYVSRLIYRLWRDFRILIRGAVVVDELVHIENGALFGPALVKAYDFESNLAIYPRIVLDELCHNIIRNSPSYKGMTHMVKPFSDSLTVGSKTYQIENGCEMNLATSFDHQLNSLFAIHPELRKSTFDELKNSTTQLEQLASNSGGKVREKYEYLINEITTTKYPEI